MRLHPALALPVVAVAVAYCQLPATPRPTQLTVAASDASALASSDSGVADASPMLAQSADGGADVVLPSRVRLVAFGSEAEFRALGTRIEEAARERQRAREERYRQQREELERRRREAQNGAQSMGDAGARRQRLVGFSDNAPSETVAAPSPAQPAARAAAASTTGSTATNAQQSITNNQEQGIDEGDIIKVRGDDLIILRRGRLFSVRIEQNRFVARSVISAAPPGVRPASWYDEMLVEGDTVLVLGYGYERRATEVNRFNLSPDGALTYRDTILLRSGDYYSSRNYATRIVGRKLVMYAPVPLLGYEMREGRYVQVPQMPGWRTLDGDWQTAADWSQIYRPVRRMGYSPILHTVHTCDLSGPSMRCASKGVVGAYARTFYVSRRGVYLWVNATPRDPDPFARTDEDLYRQLDPSNTGAVVYSFPFDGPVGAVMTTGGPVDQFSFRERDGQLEVLVAASGSGDGMWGAEVTNGDMGLYRFPVSMFSADVPPVPAQYVRHLPRLEQQYMMQNRFVGDYVLYGSGSSWWRSNTVERRVLAHNIARDQTQSIALEHGVDRIEPMDRDAVIVGGDGRNNLHFSALALDATARTAGHFSRANASQGETRSHGFFYLPTGDRQGMLGLPVRSGEERGYRQLWSGSASVLFLSVNSLNFQQLGELAARAPRQGFNDHCVASCVDWYGNARPIFYRGRVFALMGYELVEGSVANNALRERSRIDYFTALASQLSLPAPRDPRAGNGPN
ncbi:MAG: beta-propeller domain-containing protein [Myxococcales bacterium]|nr:beta-propeller domain-containing protein [Myxococcales bacterium]